MMVDNLQGYCTWPLHILQVSWLETLGSPGQERGFPEAKRSRVQQFCLQILPQGSHSIMIVSISTLHRWLRIWLHKSMPDYQTYLQEVLL